MGSNETLTCKQLVDWVTEYLEGALPEADRARVEAHLALCAGCAEYIAQVRETIRLTGKLAEEDIPPETRESLLHAFRAANHC